MRDVRNDHDLENDEAVRALGRLARAGLAAGRSRDRDRAFRAVEEAAFAPKRRWPLIVVTTFAAAAFFLLLRSQLPISYAIEGDRVGSERAAGVVETDIFSARIAFSDGSAVALRPMSRGRVVERRRKGARIALERGAARVSVVPRANAGWRWFIDAGPFVVEVTGTEFDVAWSPQDERFELALLHGSVNIIQTARGRRWRLHAGQRITLSARLGAEPHGATSFGEANTSAPAAREPAPEAPAREAPARVSAAAQPDSDSRNLPPRPSVSRRSSVLGGRAGSPDPQPALWPARVAAGEFRAVLEDARALGVTRFLREGDARALAALADAAAYGKAPETAAQVWRAMRARFPGTLAAHEAAFFLGRHEEERGRREEALRLFDLYMREAPTGPLAPEALGRRMALLERVGRSDEAHAAARVYLQRFPRGPYARLAQQIGTR